MNCDSIVFDLGHLKTLKQKADKWKKDFEEEFYKTAPACNYFKVEPVYSPDPTAVIRCTMESLKPGCGHKYCPLLNHEYKLKEAPF